jgi:ectoine hydroxylase-related dioxygenase (phytanoyl-CoA dioxygenase family)
MPGPDFLRDYHENGYLIVRAAASAEGARMLKDEVLRILEEDARIKASDPGYLRRNAHVRFSTGLHLRSPAILGYVRSAALCDIARALLGPGAELQFTSTITKAPGKNQEVDWHQDAVFEKDGHVRRLIFWNALVDTHPENGGLSVLPGSHRNGLLPHIPSPRNEFNQVAVMDVSDALPIVLAAGDMLVIHPHLVHGSPENRTNVERVALMAGYHSPDSG